MIARKPRNEYISNKYEKNTQIPIPDDYRIYCHACRRAGG